MSAKPLRHNEPRPRHEQAVRPRLAIDGSNVAFPSVKGEPASVRRLITVVRKACVAIGADPCLDAVVFLDTHTYRRFEKDNRAELQELQALLGSDGLVACKGRETADEYLLLHAREHNALVVSGDAFRDWPDLRAGLTRVSPMPVRDDAIIPQSGWLMAIAPGEDVRQSLDAWRRPSNIEGVDVPAEPRHFEPELPQPGTLEAFECWLTSCVVDNGPMGLGSLGTRLIAEFGPDAYAELLAGAVGGKVDGRLRRLVAGMPSLSLEPVPGGSPVVSWRPPAEPIREPDQPLIEQVAEAAQRIVARHGSPTIAFIGNLLPEESGLSRPELEDVLAAEIGGAKQGRLRRFLSVVQGIHFDRASKDPIVRRR